MNPYVNYYTHQAGSGLSGFEGIRFQKGHNIFGRAIQLIFPVVRFLGKHLLRAGANIVSDMDDNQVPFKEAAKRRLKESAKDAVFEGFDKVKNMQLGQGLKRRRRRRVKLTKVVKKRKTIKRKPKSKKTKRRTKRLKRFTLF